MIIIFDTCGGLCNQFYDINCAINFCISQNLTFTFRYCSLRNKNLTSWYDANFEKLFDVSFLKKYNYVDYNTLKLNPENTHNLEHKRALQILNDGDVTIQLKKLNKEYIVLKSFWLVYKFRLITENIYNYLRPSNRILTRYNAIKRKILGNGEKYNFIHYRYESDFINHFKINDNPGFYNAIQSAKHRFADKNLKIYVAASNTRQFINPNKNDINKQLLFKNDDEVKDLNFEENAFIDYMFGLHSNEVCGNRKSSFSCMLNNLKNTNNYYYG